MAVRNNVGDEKISFLDKEFSFHLLEQAIAKSSESYIEPGKEIHALQFDSELLPESWKKEFRRPAVTLHEGKYLIIFMNEEDVAEHVETKGDGESAKRIIKKGFKAKFVTKYNFNQAKVVEAPPPAPVQAEPARTWNTKPNSNWQPNNGFSKHQGGGYKGNNRFGKS